MAITYRQHLARHKPKLALALNTNGQEASTIQNIQGAFKDEFPGSMFDWHFLDQHIENQYHSFTIGRNQVIFFTATGIILACLGLLGMMADRVARFTKELGIRKVLGAEWGSLLALLLRTLLWQVLAAAAVGIPLTIFLAKLYLQQFTERMTIQWWHFVIPMGLLATILAGAISRTLLRALCVNPVKALRYE